VFAFAVVCGCNSSGGNPTGGGTDMARGPDLLTFGPCMGSMQNALNGTFATCKIEISTVTAGDVFDLIPGPFSGPMLTEVQFDLTIPKQIAVRHYSLGDFASPGPDVDSESHMLVVRPTGEKFLAHKPFDGSPLVGSVELDVYTLPTDKTGMADTSIHGTLTANLPLTPDSPGRQGDYTIVNATF
jgi:hypothetical protein